jgi:flagellar protein FlgJ
MGLLAGNAKAQETERKFAALVDGIKAGSDEKKTSGTPKSISSSQVMNDPRLPGDYISSMKIEHPSAADHAANPVGAAANSGQKGTIDKTSKLYEQALELESYFVKMMLSSMRNTISKTNLSGGNDFAGKIYDDMMYDELSRTVTKQAGFGLADQVYLELAGKS